MGRDGPTGARLFVSLTDEQQEYQRLQAAEARAAAQRHHFALDVLYAENNAVLQIHQLFARLHAPPSERPAAIVVHPIAGDGLERVARNAAEAGVGWLTLNRNSPYLEGLRRGHPALPIACVTPDQREVGRIQGRQIRSLSPQGGLIVYVQGLASASAAQDRLHGAQEALADVALDWKILSGDWTESSGRKAVTAWLRLKSVESARPALIAAQNDAMAIGARRAAVAHDRDWSRIPVIGVDGLPDGGQVLVKAGEMTATVILPPTAGAGVDVFARWLSDRQQPPAEIVMASHSYPPEAMLRPR